MTRASDPHLDSVLVGGREPRAIVIVDYDEDWPRRFESLAGAVLRAVGADAASGEGAGAGQVSVEHIGSTSVPGLAAKPIIDILLTVGNVEDERSYVPQLEREGFMLRVREPGHRMLRTPALDVHLHVFHPDDAAVRDYRDLRDWLRADDADRALYAATKRRLARQHWSDMNHYADAKSDVIALILSHARHWRAGRA